MRRSYQEEVEKLMKAIDIAIEAYQKHTPKDWNEAVLTTVLESLEYDKAMRLNADKKFRTIASLQYDIEAVFTYFQEATSPCVNYFWERIKEEGLDYKRSNKLLKILKRGKIKSNIEYQYIIDMMVVAEQQEMIRKEEVEDLNKMLELYENSKMKKK